MRVCSYRGVWFVVDLLAVMPVECGLYIWKVAAGEDVTWKLFALFRLGKCLKIWYLNFYLSSIEQILPTTRQGLSRVSKLVLMVLLLSHWLGCLFFSVALLDYTDSGTVTNITTSRIDTSWVNSSKQGTTGLLGESPSVQYVVSMYWALSTITGVGYGDIYPESALEQGYVVVVLLIGGFVMSLVIANLETVIAQADATSVLFQSKTNYLKKVRGQTSMTGG